MRLPTAGPILLKMEVVNISKIHKKKVKQTYSKGGAIQIICTTCICLLLKENAQVGCFTFSPTVANFNQPDFQKSFPWSISTGQMHIEEFSIWVNSQGKQNKFLYGPVEF